jgi:hypothetical protein
MLTLDTILNGLTTEQMDLVIRDVQAGGGSNKCGSGSKKSRSHSKGSRSASCGSRSYSYDPCYNPCYNPCG